MKKIFIACMALFALAACEDDIDHSGEVHATAEELHSIELTTAVFEAAIYGNGVTERGICWAETSAPTLSDFSVADTEKGAGAFTAELTNLKPNTTYYVRAYGIAGTKTYFSSTREFKTFDYLTATVSSTAPSMFTISVDGNVQGGVDSWDILERGICYATTPNPTTANSKVRATGARGSFTAVATGLSPKTQYYIRAYATYDGGTVYSNAVTATTVAGFEEALGAANLNYGIVRDAKNKFAMHYSINWTSKTISVTYIESTGDRDAKHFTGAVTVGQDSTPEITWDEVVNGDVTFSGIVLDGTKFTVKGSDGLSLDTPMSATDIYAMYVNRDWGGVDRSSDIRDQSEQPACFPSSYFTDNWVKEFSAGRCGIVCYYAFAQTYLFFKNTVDGSGKPVIPITEDVAHFSYSGNHETPWGSLTDEEYNKAYEATKPLLDLWNHADGLMIIKEVKNSLTPEAGGYNYYAVSPTGTFWAKLYFRAYGQ